MSSAAIPAAMSLYALVLVLLAGGAALATSLLWRRLVAGALAVGGAPSRPLFYAGATTGVAIVAAAVVAVGLVCPSGTVTPPANALGMLCIGFAAVLAFGAATRLAARSPVVAGLALAGASLATLLAVARVAVPAKPDAPVLDPLLLVAALGGVVVTCAARLALPFLAGWMARGTLSERRALLLDGCDAAVALCEHDRVLVATRCFADSLGLEPEAIEGRSLGTLVFGSGDASSLALEPGRPLPATAYTPHGHRIDLEVTVSPLRQPGLRCVSLRRCQAASSADPSAAAARTLRRRIARSAASEVSIS